MADAAAAFRQQRANRLLTLLAVGKYADAAFECCSPTVSPLILQQATQTQFAAGGTIAWVEPLQITPQSPPKINTGLCIRVCAVFQRYAFGRGQVIFDIGFGADDRVFEIVPDPAGFHLVAVPKHPGSFWAIEQLPDPVAQCRIRVECHLAAHSKQVLAYPVPPHVENCQTGVSFKTYPEGVPVLAQGSSTEKVHMLVADANITPVVTAEFSFNYSRRVLTVKTPQPGSKPPIIHLHESLKKQCLAADPMMINFQDPGFQNYLNATGLRKSVQEDEVMFARRVHMYIAATMAYVPVSTTSRTGGAAAVCLQRETDASGHAVLFVAILRANAVPARVSVGRWVSPEISPAYHCRAEFFADMVGWVPVETTEKGEALYFGSDAKAPFCLSSFGENSTFRVQSTTTHAYGATLPHTVHLNWREPHFVYIAGNLTHLNSNVEQWTSVIGDTTTSMPLLPGQAHQTPTTQKFSKAHESGPPIVGARGGATNRPYSQSVSVTNTAITHNPTPSHQGAPPVPMRTHAHSSVQFTTTGPPPVLVHSQVPPPLPPHGHHPGGGPPPLPPQQGGYGSYNGGFHSGYNAGPPPLPPQSSQPQYGAPPPLPPHQGGYQPQGQPGYGQAVNTVPMPQPFTPRQQQQGPPPLPQYNTQVPPNQQYGGGPPALPPQNYNQQPVYNGFPQQQGPPPQLPAHQQPQYQPPSQQHDQQYLQNPPAGQQYQQYSPRESPSNPPAMGVPVMVQPRPVSIKPQQHLANLEASTAASADGQSSGPSPRGSGAPVGGKMMWPPAGANGEAPAANGAGATAAPAPAKAKVGAGTVKAWPPKQPAAAKGPGGPPLNGTPKGPVKMPAGGPAKGPLPTPGGAKKGPAPAPLRRTFARAQFDHEPQDHLELPLSRGDIVEILSEDDSGWWKAERLGKIGIIPAPYIEKLPPGTRVAKANFPFDAPEPTDLGLQVGEFALIITSDGDWWQAEARGKKGSVPNNYVEEVRL